MISFQTTNAKTTTIFLTNPVSCCDFGCFCLNMLSIKKKKKNRRTFDRRPFYSSGYKDWSINICNSLRKLLKHFYSKKLIARALLHAMFPINSENFNLISQMGRAYEPFVNIPSDFPVQKSLHGNVALPQSGSKGATFVFSTRVTILNKIVMYM